MKTLLTIIAVLSATAAFALDPTAPVCRDVNGEVVEWRDGGLPQKYAATPYYHAATWRHESDGWRNQTAQEIADRAAAAEAAAAEADAQASLPAVFENGIAVLDDDSHHMEIVPVEDGTPPITIQVSNSPLTKEDRERLKASGKAVRAARKEAARKAKNQKEINDIILDYLFGTEDQ